MNVCLINPKYPIGVNNNPPLGLAYIAATLEESGFGVQIIDDEILRLNEDEWKNKIKKLSPDIVGITTTTPTVNKARRIARIIKESSSALVVFGGVHASALPIETVRDPNIDIVVVGEGEQTFLELIEYLEGGKEIGEIDGLVYKDNGEVKYNRPRSFVQELDKLPFPARHLLNMEIYIQRNSDASKKIFIDILPIFSGKELRVTEIFIGRGCPYQCTFCAGKVVLGRHYRLRSISNVIEELKSLIKDYKINCFFIQDDTPTLSKEWIKDFCQRMRYEKLPIYWAANARASNLDEEIIMEMKETKCCCLAIGVESYNQEFLDRIKKGERVERIEKAFTLCRKYGLNVFGYFMFNLPGETLADMGRTLEFAKRLKPEHAQFALLTPYPGTEIYQREVNNPNDDWDRYLYMHDVAHNFTKDVSDEELLNFLGAAYKRYNDYQLRHPNKKILRLILHKIIRNPWRTIDWILRAFLPEPIRKLLKNFKKKLRS